MSLKYGLDILTPNSNPKKDGWEPLMLNDVARRTFDSVEALFAYDDAMKAGNRTLKTRVVEVDEGDPYQL